MTANSKARFYARGYKRPRAGATVWLGIDHGRTCVTPAEAREIALDIFRQAAEAEIVCLNDIIKEKS